MDNMPVGWDRPQEDEFALMNLGLGSPYEVVVFPNRRRRPPSVSGYERPHSPHAKML